MSNLIFLGIVFAVLLLIACGAAAQRPLPGGPHPNGWIVVHRRRALSRRPHRHRSG